MSKFIAIAYGSPHTPRVTVIEAPTETAAFDIAERDNIPLGCLLDMKEVRRLALTLKKVLEGLPDGEE